MYMYKYYISDLHVLLIHSLKKHNYNILTHTE